MGHILPALSKRSGKASLQVEEGGKGMGHISADQEATHEAGIEGAWTDWLPLSMAIIQGALEAKRRPGRFSDSEID